MFKKKKVKFTQRRKLITKSDPKSPISEQYRTIRTNIQFSTIDEEVRTIVVTSSGPGEGKSTTAANLAVVFAQQGKKVLLVDTDLRKPTMHYTFNVNNAVGLTSVLTKAANIQEAVQEDEEGLYLLTSGPLPPNPAELLGSKAMKDFTEEALQVFDMILFDTPPILVVTDAQILANKSDGTILVVSSELTEKESSLKAKELLLSAQAKIIGVVLNNKKLQKSQNYYYYNTK